jgi:hypothetical protein
VTIEPDDKDWTWVLSRPCPECGFDPAEHPQGTLAASLASFGPTYAALLAQPNAGERPHPDQWSAIEYGYHVADALELGVVRLGRMLDEDDPLFENWDQDVTAVESRYDLAEAGPTVTKVTAAAERISSLVARVSGDQWERPGRRSDGSPFTVESFTRYLVHDPLHHVWDIERGFASLG